jgi:hypothetical protein
VPFLALNSKTAERLKTPYEPFWSFSAYQVFLLDTLEGVFERQVFYFHFLKYFS